MALVVTLKSGEAVRLTDRRTNEITRVVVARSGGPVRLVIDAPGDVHILREELLARSGHDGQHEGSASA